MQKKIVICPKCRTSLEVTNPKAQDFLLISCPQCATKLRVLFRTGETVIADPVPDRKTIGWLMCVGVKYSLKLGVNTIGRKSSNSEATIQIETDDKSVSRVHAEIEVVMLKNERVKAVLRDAREVEKSAIKPMFFGDEEIYPEDRLDLEEGDLFKIGGLMVKYTQKPQ